MKGWDLTFKGPNHSLGNSDAAVFTDGAKTLLDVPPFKKLTKSIAIKVGLLVGDDVLWWTVF